MEKKILVRVMILFLLVMTVLAVWKVAAAPSSFVGFSGSTGGEKIGVIEINGVISGDDGVSWMTGSNTGAVRIMEAIRKAQKRPDIKVVVLRINSPGGTSTAAQEIGIELAKLRESGKPVLTSMGDTCASGGYWIASGSDYIMANGTTLTGSIGVIMEWMNLQELYEKLGIKPEVIKSGEYKDMGSAVRPLSEAERQLFEAMIEDTYQQFLDQVHQGREGKIDRDELRSVADGRVFTGRQALELGLVDGIGNYYDALRQAAAMAGLPENSTVEILNSTDFWQMLHLSPSVRIKELLQPGGLLKW